MKLQPLLDRHLYMNHYFYTGEKHEVTTIA